MNDTDEYFKYDLKSVEKINKTSFKVNCEADLYVDLDKEVHFWINVYHNSEGNEEFSEKPTFSVPKMEFCEFMNSPYRQYMWNNLKDVSNFPPPETCPVTPNHYYLRDYIFNGEKYKALMRPGMIRIDMFVSKDHEDSHITKMGVRIFAKVNEVE